MALLFKIKEALLILQNRVFKKEAGYTCVSMLKYITSRVSIVGFNALTQLYSQKEVVTL